MPATSDQNSQLENLLSRIRSNKISPEGIEIFPEQIDASGVKSVVSAINRSTENFLSITFNGNYKDGEINAVFRDVADLLVTDQPMPDELKLKRLKLTFLQASIRSSDVVELLQHPHCPFGLELSFIHCIDSLQHPALDFSSVHTNEEFQQAIANNRSVIRLSISDGYNLDFECEHRPYQHYVDFDEFTRRNQRQFFVMQELEKEPEAALKQQLGEFIQRPDSQKLLELCQTGGHDKLYKLFKGLFYLGLNNTKQGFELLSNFWIANKSVNEAANQALAEYLFYGNHIEGQFAKDYGEVASDLQVYLEARNRFILWLLRDSDIRGSNSPIINSCLQQLLNQTHAPLLPDSKMIIITYNELFEMIKGFLKNYSGGFFGSGLIPGKFTHEALGWLKDEKVKKMLVAKFGTSNVEVLEEIICRGMINPKTSEQQNICEVVDNARKVLSTYFDNLAPTPTSAVDLSAVAADFPRPC